ncbi:glycosyltransferase [Haloferula chungangensis]|uniref:Glycosyltransferase n=1 Tax=Haloferula chungangensis TaxID=1048331 RepID=A0ABW2L3I5_9BACT
MRIDIITDTYAPDVNGVAMTIGRLVEGLRGRGHLVHVIRSGEDSSASTGQTSTRFLRMPGYKEVRIGLPRPVKFRKRWNRKRPDVVYVATESPMGLSALQAAQSLGIPSIAGFHTCFHEYLEQYRLGSLKSPMLGWLRKIHELANVTMTPSEDVARTLRQHDFKNVEVMGRGVDSELFHPDKRNAELRREWGADDETPVYLLVGRVAPEKNLEMGLEAFSKIRETHPKVRCVVVGDGPLRKRLEERFSDVHFAGVRSGDDLAQHYASADVLLFPSETETFGNVLLEGMASGLVTVSYDYAASRIHVVDGRNGLKASKGDEQEFRRRAEAASKICSWKDVRREARSHAEEHGWTTIIDIFESALEKTAGRFGTPKSPDKGKRLLHFESLFLSDLHLGTPEAKTTELLDFLKHCRCKTLYLNGDIIDGWALKRGTSWSKRHTRVIRAILRKSEKEGTKVIYLRGNHDDILDRFFPMNFGPIELKRDAIHTGLDGKRYLVIHGDGFDAVSTRFRWLAVLGAFGYDSLLKINRVYNHYRKWRGKGYYSVSKKIKEKVKGAVSFISQYEEQLIELAEKRGCDGIICGHIHTPEDKLMGNIRYLNSGDWVENMSCVVEHKDGRIEVLYYQDFLTRLGEIGRQSLLQAVVSEVA